ncbi:hypothetical protein ATANTOWER_004612 [Ataeniobius toweri]|uniref:Uncharacterized protein n=1 Tax=Ataeniobius toweri TaxID=208326 RepID=A0ABU7A4Z3_9TELE|nr:hypothetical protein [Ataeniobius toweri]
MRAHLGTPEERCRCHPAPPFLLTSAERDQQQEPEGPDPDTEPRRKGPLPRTGPSRVTGGLVLSPGEIQPGNFASPSQGNRHIYRANHHA